MKIDFKKIISIKNKQELNEFQLDKPIFQSNYLFHYLILIGNLDGLKLLKFPVYIENNDGLNGFHLAAKEYNFEILCYLIDNYPDYIYNKNIHRESFANYLPYEEFNSLIKKYPKLDWEELIINGTKIPNIIFRNILVNLKYDELNEFIKLYPAKPENKNQFLFSIISNANLNTKNKIKILEQYSNKELNEKSEMGEGLILSAIDIDDNELVDYLLSRNIDVDYYTFIRTNNPLRISVYSDILNNEFKYTKKILERVIKNNQTFYNDNDKYMDTIAHAILYIRTNRNKQVLPLNSVKNINYSPDFEILNLCDNKCWNQENIDKITPLNLITNLDYDIYSKIIKDNNIHINPNILEQLKNNPENIYNKSWIKLFESQPKYIIDNDIKLDENQYSHYTIFQAKFKDVGIFSIYLSDTYKNLLIPNTNSYQLGNLTFEDTFPFSDDVIAREPVFPWIVSFYNENEYYIHPYLNNIINNTRRENTKRFGAVFISLIYDKILHANILIYDFKNMTVERFEPYGNTGLIDSSLDDILEEELTWNTGLRYLRPSDYMPFSGFQTISDENYAGNKKAGDFGGFCLAWCLWYLETKLKNPDVDSKTLVNKLINKLGKQNIKFSEHIRNYSNKINEKRIEYLESIGMDPKLISNVQLTIDSNIKLTNYLVNKFNNMNRIELN